MLGLLLLDDLDLWEREDQPDAALDHRPLALQKLVFKVPWEHKIIIGLPGAALLFAHDRDFRPQGPAPVLLRIAVGGAFDEASVDPAPLEERIPLRRGAVAVNPLPPPSEIQEGGDQFVGV